MDVVAYSHSNGNALTAKPSSFWPRIEPCKKLFDLRPKLSSWGKASRLDPCRAVSSAAPAALFYAPQQTPLRTSARAVGIAETFFAGEHATFQIECSVHNLPVSAVCTVRHVARHSGLWSFAWRAIVDGRTSRDPSPRGVPPSKKKNGELPFSRLRECPPLEYLRGA